MGVSIQEYEKSLAALEEAIALTKSQAPDIQKKAFRDAAIQRFEFCLELAWKTAKKEMGSTATAPKTIFREMAQNQLIDDATMWLDFWDARNLTSHTYNENMATQIFQVVQKFSPEGAKLLQKFKKK